MEGGELKEIILMKLSPLLQASIPPDYVANLVHDTLGQELINKINEMNLVLANHISDKVRFFNYFRLKQARKILPFFSDFSIYFRRLYLCFPATLFHIFATKRITTENILG